MSKVKELNSIVCIMGPTASGKTNLAVQLSHYFPFEIISVDSALVYRDMDIGTAKPTEDVLKKNPHRLINICDPKQAYSAAQFRIDALREIENIFSQKKIPLLVGGTMLYFRALQKGLSSMPSANADLREKLNKEGEIQGWKALHAQLVEVDPVAARRIHPNDPQRIQRALEVYLLSGKNITTWQHESAMQNEAYQFINIAIAPSNRDILHRRIADRFSSMLEQGLIEEVKSLYERGDLTSEMPSIRAVGYRQVWDYLTGKLSYAEMKEKGIIATRQLAKRQLTWLRAWPDITWFDSEDSNLLLKVSNLLRN